MRAVSQLRVGKSEAVSRVDCETRTTAPAPGRDPRQILREFIASLNSGNDESLDPAEVSGLVAEAREALEHACEVARTVDVAQKFVRQAQFDKALEILDAGLDALPENAALTARRRRVQEQKEEYLSGVAVRAVLEEAQSLSQQDRPDLAINLLKEKALELPDHAELISRLESLEAALPAWERNRCVQATLERSAALEQLQQWQWALTILEEALESYPMSEELIAAAQRVRERHEQDERERKLARRVRLIRQSIESRSWRHAIFLLTDTQREFPGVQELGSLREEVEAGFRRAERDAVIAEVRQCIADGELDLADQSLRRGTASLGPEPALTALRKELEGQAKYREGMRNARSLFGRGQLQEAENELEGLVGQDRGEALELLDAIQRARTVDDETNFCERGRHQALRLLQENQVAQAVDLLSNLLALFPESPILQHDFLAAKEALSRQTPTTAVPVAGQNGEKENREAEDAGTRMPALLPTLSLLELNRQDANSIRVKVSSRTRRTLVVAAGSLLMVAGARTAWEISRSGTAPAAVNANSVAAQSPDTRGGQQTANATRPSPDETKLISEKTEPSLTDGAHNVPDALIRKAELLDHVSPVYPAEARGEGRSGVVQLEGTVDEQGAVKNVKVVSGDAILAAAAGMAVLRWKYKPATAAGQPIASHLTVEMSFQERNR